MPAAAQRAIRIVRSSRQRRGRRAARPAAGARMRRSSARWRPSSGASAAAATPRCWRSRGSSTARRADRGQPRPRCAPRRGRSGAGQAARSGWRPRNIRSVARGRFRALVGQPGAGRAHRAARHAARSRRLLRARRPLPAAVVAADDGDSGACRGRAGGVRRLSAARSDGDVRGARGRRHAAVPDRRRARDRGARLRHRDDPARRQDRRSRQRLRRGGESAGRRRLRHRLLRRAERDRRRVVDGRADMDRRGPDRAGRARSRRARDPHHATLRLARAVAARDRRQLPATGPAAAALASNGGIVVTRNAGRGDRALRSGWRRSMPSATATPWRRA